MISDRLPKVRTDSIPENRAILQGAIKPGNFVGTRGRGRAEWTVYVA
jgi:hypothetical protein